MANWCSNTLVFEGEDLQIKKVTDLFKSMRMQEELTSRGQLPSGCIGDGGYMFDIFIDLCGSIKYQTKWTPNRDVVKWIAEVFKIKNLTYEYEEMGCAIYGRLEMIDGEVKDTYLSQDDFDRYHYCEETDMYIMGGVSFEVETDILDMLLAMK